MELIITKHAQQRIKERVGLKSVERMHRLVIRAYEQGLSFDNTDCKLILRSLESIDKEKYPFREFRMYHEQIFVFMNNYLLTVLPVDHALRKKMEKRRHKQNQKLAIA